MMIVCAPSLLALWGVWTFRVYNKPPNGAWRSAIEQGFLLLTVLGHWLSSGILLVGVRHSPIQAVFIIFNAILFVTGITFLKEEHIDRLSLYVILGLYFIA